MECLALAVMPLLYSMTAYGAQLGLQKLYHLSCGGIQSKASFHIRFIVIALYSAWLWVWFLCLTVGDVFTFDSLALLVCNESDSIVRWPDQCRSPWLLQAALHLMLTVAVLVFMRHDALRLQVWLIFPHLLHFALTVSRGLCYFQAEKRVIAEVATHLALGVGASIRVATL